MRLLRLALPALLASVPGAAAAANIARFEIDAIYPRNETYIYNPASPVIPIAFQVQNLSRPVELSSLQFYWTIIFLPAYGGSQGVDAGSWDVPDDVANGGTAVLVAHTDPSTWDYTYFGPDDRFVLAFDVDLWNATERLAIDSCFTTANCDAGTSDCATGDTNAFIPPPFLSYVVFSLRDSDWQAGGGNASAVAQDITQAPTCPLFGGLFEAYADAGGNGDGDEAAAASSSSATATASASARCPLSAVYDLGSADGAPCATPVDRAAQSSILAAVSSLAASSSSSRAAASYSATHVRTVSPTRTSAAAPPGRDAGLAPVLAAAAAGALYGLV